MPPMCHLNDTTLGLCDYLPLPPVIAPLTWESPVDFRTLMWAVSGGCAGVPAAWYPFTAGEKQCSEADVVHGWDPLSGSYHYRGAGNAWHASLRSPAPNYGTLGGGPHFFLSQRGTCLNGRWGHSSLTAITEKATGVVAMSADQGSSLFPRSHVARPPTACGSWFCDPMEFGDPHSASGSVKWGQFSPIPKPTLLA